MLIYEQWIQGLDSAGIHPISDDTVAKILAIVYVYGGSMEFIYNEKLMRHSLCPKTSKIKWGRSA